MRKNYFRKCKYKQKKPWVYLVKKRNSEKEERYLCIWKTMGYQAKKENKLCI